VNASQIASRSARGGALIFIGNFLALVIGFFASIIIARLLGPEGYGLYSLAILVPATIQLFLGFGIGTAVTRFSSYYIAQGKPALARKITDDGAKITIVSALAVTALAYFTAGFFATVLLGRPSLAPLIQDASLLVLGLTLFGFGTSVLVGWNMMGFVGVTAVLQDVFKLVICVGLLLVGFGPLGAVLGNLLSYLIAGMIILGRFYLSHPGGDQAEGGKPKSQLGQMFRFGAPAYAGRVLSTFANSYFVPFLLAAIVSTQVFAYFSAAGGFVTVIGTATTATGTALFAAFASLEGLQKDSRQPLTYAVRYTGYVVSPLAFFMITSSALLMRLYGQAFASGSLILALYAASMIPFSLGSAVIPNYFNGMGKTRLNFWYLAVDTVVTIGLSVALALTYGLYGLLAAQIISNFVQIGWGIFLLKRTFNTMVDFKSAGLGIACSFCAAVLVTFIGPVVHSYLIELVLRLVAFGAVYLTLAPLAKVIDSDDIARIRSAFSGSAGLRPIINAVMTYESKVYSLRRFMTRRQA
jgi:stage V sporulation protein B